MDIVEADIRHYHADHNICAGGTSVRHLAAAGDVRDEMRTVCRLADITLDELTR